MATSGELDIKQRKDVIAVLPTILMFQASLPEEYRSVTEYWTVHGLKIYLRNSPSSMKWAIKGVYLIFETKALLSSLGGYLRTNNSPEELKDNNLKKRKS